MSNREKIALSLHRQWKGKIEVISRVQVDTKEALSVAYTPRSCGTLQRDTKRHKFVVSVYKAQQYGSCCDRRNGGPWPWRHRS
jgi:malic enzyme